jgi:hypothetical protein
MQATKALLLIAAGVLQATAQIPTKTGPIEDAPLPSLDPECASVVSSVAAEATDAPVPDRSISNIAVAFAIGRVYNTEDPCELPVVTGESAEPFSAWATSYIEWQSGYIPEFWEVWSACSDEPIISDIIPIGPSVCSNLAAEITGDSGSGDDDDNDGDSNNDDGNGDSDDSRDGGSNDDDGNAGTRQTVSLVGAIVAAGMVVAGLY